jgi:sugar phosphate isomerase/epimerase
MRPTRRQSLQAAALASLGGLPVRADGPVHHYKLGISTYSYWHFKGPKYPIDKAIEHAAQLGFEGVELLHRQFESEDPSYLHNLKRLAYQRSIGLTTFSIHQDFVSPKPEERAEAVRHTRHCIDLAVELGCPAMRINSGRWKTIATFDDLMKVKGNEPALPGYTNEDALRWCIDGIRECIPAAEKAGVMLVLENHWGVTMSVDNIMRIYKEVNSPWLGINLDIGNWPGDPYEGITRLAPYATVVHAKTYYGAGEWYTLDLDYPRIAGILRKANFKGWISLEMEGKETPETAVAKSYALLRSTFG